MHEDPTAEAREQEDPQLNEHPNPGPHDNPELNGQKEPEYNEIPNAGFNPQKIVLPTKRRDPVFYLALTLAAICILGTLGVATFFTGFIAGHSLNKGNTIETRRIIIVKRMPIFENGNPQRGQIAAKIGIIQTDNGIQFTQPEVKVPAGSGILWINQTDQTQLLILDQRPALTIPPNQTNILFIREGNRSYTLHLASDNNTTITIYATN